MSPAITLSFEPAVVDVLGIEIREGDRVWLVTRTRVGLDRVLAGRVEGVTRDGRVHWVTDPLSEDEWTRVTWGCSITSHGVYAPPQRHNGADRYSRPDDLKVVARRRVSR